MKGSLRKIFGEEIGRITGFRLVCKEVWAGLVGPERDWRVQWEDGRFTWKLMGHVSSHVKTGTYRGMGKGGMG